MTKKFSCKDEGLLDSSKIVGYNGKWYHSNFITIKLKNKQFKIHNEEMENKGKTLSIIQKFLHDDIFIKIVILETRKKLETTWRMSFKILIECRRYKF